MNASTIGMKRDLVELLTQAQMDDAVRVLVFTGTRTGVLGRRRHEGLLVDALVW